MKSNFRDNLIKEYNELFERREKLSAFLNEVDEDKRPCDNSRSVLIAQLYAMDTYIQVLRIRFLELHMNWEDFNKDKTSWVKDYSVGYDTARDQIKEWCNSKVEKIINDQRSDIALTSWTYGYKSALIDVIERIERM